MSMYTNDTEEVILADGKWSLVRLKGYGEWKSWLVHGCGTDKCQGHVVGHYVRGRPPTLQCHICRDKIPEHLFTLWTLHNFDAMSEVP